MAPVHKYYRSIPIWLFLVMLLVMAIIVVGGATRLTNSGLSITEWAPITGALPPLNTADWLAEFEKYKQIPEFLAEHPDMDLAGFKFIYFWEWTHRQLGRLIGVAYLLPFLYYAFRRRLPKGKAFLFVVPVFLIGLQGAIGWWMVHSGLQEGMVDVSQYRLATHLGLAFIILGYLFWLRKYYDADFVKKPIGSPYKNRTAIFAILVYLQIILGAFVAGTKSGRSYNEWPLMDGEFIPEGYAMMSPLWKNLFENVAAIQFNHRLLAYIIFGMAIWLWSTLRRSPVFQGIAGMVMILILWQVGLGIWTLLSGENFDPTHIRLALLHQFSAIFVFLASLSLAMKTRYKLR